MIQRLLARMKCPVCGATSPDDTSTDMQVKRFPSSDALYVRVGDRFKMRFPQVVHAGFRIVKEPPPGEPFRLLLTWRCPTSGESDLWAMVEMQPEGEWARITSIQAVERTPEVIAKVNAVSYGMFLTGSWPPRSDSGEGGHDAH